MLESNGITVRLLQGQAYKNGILLELTGAEYKLLCFFMQHPNAVLSKEQILDALWDCDGDYIDSSALTVYIRRLRMKIEDDPGKPQMLLTLLDYCWFFCCWAAASGAFFSAISKGRARFWNRQSSKSKAVWMATRMHDWTATGRENFTVCFTPLMHWRQF